MVLRYILLRWHFASLWESMLLTLCISAVFRHGRKWKYSVVIFCLLYWVVMHFTFVCKQTRNMWKIFILGMFSLAGHVILCQRTLQQTILYIIRCDSHLFELSRFAVYVLKLFGNIWRTICYKFNKEPQSNHRAKVACHCLMPVLHHWSRNLRMDF